MNITQTLQQVRRGTKNDLETILYKAGDCPDPPTEDELLNMLIGTIALHESRCEELQMAIDHTLKSHEKQIELLQTEGAFI